jgi:1-acyl-sn-glycerol-3-phosphate acyltransferase
VRVFYRRCEVTGLDAVPRTGPVIFCANHASALADAAIVQAACPRPVHPLARSGLFANPLLRPILAAIQAVPIYRAQDTGGDTSRNVDSFARCRELLVRGEALLVFPEGQSHSDPRLRPLRTGAARMALEAATHGVLPLLVPVGLTFTDKGRFRNRVLVQFGTPLAPRPLLGEEPDETVRRLTAEVLAGLERVTLNVDSADDLELLRRLERFFAFRGGRARGAASQRGSLAHRFRAWQRLVEALRRLRASAPDQAAALARRLGRFERLRRRYGVADHHLTVRYTPSVVTGFVLRSLLFLLLVFPLALWGSLNSAVPYLATRHAARRLARGTDQQETAKILLGIFLFALFWSVQTSAVYWRWGALAATLYGASLPATAAVALAVRRRRARIWENVRVFFLVVRRRDLRGYLLAKRQELEVELARLARRVPRRPPGPLTPR